MRFALTHPLALVAAVMMTFAGCSCDDGNGGEPGPDAGDDAGYNGPIIETDGGPGSQCLPDGHPCAQSQGGVCCSGVCNAESNTCRTGGSFCQAPGEACGNNTDCCTNNCFNGTCADVQCLDVGATCSAPGDCCSGTCTGGACVAIAGQSCDILGQACSADSECCSNNCQGGVCVRAYFCQADSDICYGNDDCCGRVCSKNDGTPGLCQTVSGGGGGTCTQGGNPCTASGNPCCSRVCADPGSGTEICQPAGGCALTGAYCETAQDCCGGGSNPNGSVMCVNNRCDNGQSCNPVGNICGAQVLADGGSIPASQNCCDGRKEVCKADSSGIPRCFGGCVGDKCPTECPNGYDGTAGCCIEAGQQCQFKDQCCGGAPCLPDGQGVLRCTTATCTPLGEACTAGTTVCCAGDCLPSGGELSQDVCKIPPPPSDGGVPGTDGGTGGDGGVCSPNGQTCAVAGDCCSGLCTNGVCGVPTACQPQGGACTAGADCCTGLGCDIPSGETTGTCQPSTCANAGQSCSSGNPCCNGLACLTTTGAPCNDTSCACKVVIN